MDIKRALRNARDTGKITIGFRETIKTAKKGKVKLAIVARNCPEKDVEELRKLKVPVYVYQGSNAEFGAASGKPYTISTMGIVDPGKSDILALKGE
ncbi:MAG: 50S ribosomal protein L30e [Thermoplasmatota archaeon]